MVAFTTTYLFETELEKLLTERIEALKDDLSLGSLRSFDEYHSTAGRIQGLREALDCMAEARKSADRKSRQ